MCWDGELLLTMLLAASDADGVPAAPLPDWFDGFLAQCVTRADLTASGTCRAAHLLAAWWRQRAVRVRK